MKPGWKGILRMLGLGIVLGCGLPSQAKTTLDVWFTDFSCSTTHNGITTGIPCATSSSTGGSVTSTLGAGDSERIDAILHYSYSDQGLPALPFGFIQMDAGGFTMQPVDFESGVIFIYTALCQGKGCASPPWVIRLGTPTFPPVILGSNNTPDNLTGQLNVFSGYAFDNTVTSPYAITASISAATLTFNGVATPVAPIPEPSTWALMLLGLGLVGAAARRRLARAPADAARGTRT